VHKLKTAMSIILLLTSCLLFIQKVNAIEGEAKVYIVCLSGVPGHWTDNPSRVKDGALEACMLKGDYIEGNLPRAHPKRGVNYPPYYDAKPIVVTGWSLYETIVTSFSGVILVNTHGEYLPVPGSYSKEQWVDKIAEAMLNRRLTWVHTGGYTFYRTWHQQSGEGGEWTEYVGGRIVGAGFRRLMTHINKTNVDLWPPAGYENALTAFSILYHNQIGLSWVYDGTPVTNFRYATLGRPLKFDDFKDYVMMPLYEYTHSATGKSYWAGAAIVFTKGGARYNVAGRSGSGAYVHIGSRYLYDGNGTLLDSDFGRGFIGTAAALWVESTGFNPSFDMEETTHPPWGWYRGTGIAVYPSVSGVYQFDSLNIYVRVNFAFHAVLRGHKDDHSFTFWAPTGTTGFFITNPGGEWSDVTMRADLGNPNVSRQGRGRGFELKGAYQEGEAAYGLVASSYVWFLGALPVHPIWTAFWTGVGGVLLMSEWIGRWEELQAYSGVNEFASYIWFTYLPLIENTSQGDYRYEEVSCVVAVDLKIPISGRAGWKILPITYFITQNTQCNAANLYVTDTIEIAIWTTAGAGQNDAGSGGDAGNSFSTATILNDIQATYYGYLGGTDNEDWYQFNVNVGKPIYLVVSPPPYTVNFDLELYNASGAKKAESHEGPGLADSVHYVADSSGWWRIRIYRVTGSGVYKLEPASGCPFLYVWNGNEYVIDNNVLPASETSNGADVEDYYKLEQPLVRRDGKYYLLLSEFEREHSYFDTVRLIAVDHAADVNVALTPTGEILTYKNPYAPVSAIDEHGNSCLGNISSIDNNYYEGSPSSCLLIDFGSLDTSQAAKLVLRANLETILKSPCIHVQVLDKNGVWSSVAVVQTRKNMSTQIIDIHNYLSNVLGNIQIRLYFTAPHRIDYVALDTTPEQPITIRHANLVYAYHSTRGEVKEQLMKTDGVYAELLPGEQIELAFTLPQNTKQTRTFILYIKGHYHTITNKNL